MEQNQTNVANVLPGLRIVPHKSREHARKRCAKPSSVKLFCSTLCRYDVHIACDLCIHISDSTHKCGLNKFDHECSKDRLVLFAKNATDNGDLLRVRPADYNPLTSDHICEHLGLNETCFEKHLCPYPHTDLERVLWKEDYSNNVSIAGLVTDLRESSLRLSVVTEHLCKKFSGTFKLICAACFEESGQISSKLHHVPECALSGHAWTESKKLVFESSLDNQLIDFDDVHIHDEEKQELVSCVRSLISEVSEDDIADEAARLRQVHRSALSHAARNAADDEGQCQPCHSDSDDSDNENNYLAKTDEAIFDDDATDVLNDVAFDEDTGDCQDQKATGPRVQGGYYKMSTEERTRDNSVVYGCGKIRLLGAFAGSCMVVGGELNGCEVELRGRINCGPAFDGDEVEVKVYKKDKTRESKADKSEVDNYTSGNSPQFYGTVVNVIKRSVHRTARTFVCTVGRHDGNLMMPLCGTAPKFHILDSYLSKRYGRINKRNYVAVYDSDLQLRKTVRLDPCRRKEMLFVVKYLKWEDKHKYPLGYVCRILRQSRTDEDSQKMLNLMYELPLSEDTELEIMAEEVGEQEDPKLVVREDLCGLLTVSIDPPGAKDVDDALSLKEANGKFVVWIHIADVTFYIQKGDVLDVKAQNHAFSFYPPLTKEPRHMLPKKLAEGKCSLLENSRRRAVSVRFELTAAGEVLSSTGPSPSWIQNDKQLSYKYVQEIIDGPFGDDDGDDCNYNDEPVDQDIEQMLIHLHRLATILRERRMRDGCHYYEYSRKDCFNREGIDDPFDVDQNHDAKWLVEEFMILTNQHVGRILKQKYPDCTPFRVQEVPREKLLESWKASHGCIVPFSFFLKQYLSAEDSRAVTREDSRSETPLFMLQHCWNALRAAVNHGDVRKLKTVIGSELLHPLHNNALLSWFRIQELAYYACSSSVRNGTDVAGHFGLQTCNHVQFTSPLRRYVDIIVHRLVKADRDQPPPYTPDEVMALCKKMNARKSMHSSYAHSCELLKMASMLRRPIYMPSYVETYDDFGIHLASPYFRTASVFARRLKFSEMTVHENPVPSRNSAEKVTLRWSKRYYDTRMSRTTNARSHLVADYVLDSGMFGTTVSPDVWLSMHDAIKGQREHLLPRVSKALQANYALQQPHRAHGTVREVTSEMAENKPLVRHHVKFSCDIVRGAVLSVQFGAQTLKGFLQPVIKLVNLTHDKDICVEHQRDPVCAFASVATRKIKNGYQNIEEYQNIWKAILEMEAATNAVQNNESVVCSHVPVKFIRRNGKIYGKLKLSKEFCDKRYINIYRVSKEETHDYMCIRYFLYNSRLAKSFGRNVWVAHAAVVDTLIECAAHPAAVTCNCVKDVIKLTVKCNCMDTEAPSELFNCTTGSSAVECTVEFLQRALPDK